MQPKGWRGRRYLDALIFFLEVGVDVEAEKQRDGLRDRVQVHVFEERIDVVRVLQQEEVQELRIGCLVT